MPPKCDGTQGLIAREIFARFQEENGLSCELVSVFNAHLSALYKSILLQCSYVVRNLFLAFFKAFCQFGLGRELTEVAVSIKKAEDFPLQAVRVWGECWDR